MSVTVRHINADASFLLIFSPEPYPTPSHLLSANGAFSVLCDPWISTGASIVNSPWFAITKRVVPADIEHLSEIEEPDVVLVSQNKPDHCHKETLLQLRPEGKTIIAAEPGAAKAIKSWNHFDPNRVHGLRKYNANVKFGNSLRLRIPPLSAEGHPGEVNISFIPARNYMTGLHNGYGITYQAPTRVKTRAHVSTIDLPRSPNTKYFHLPMSPQTLPPPSPPPMSPPMSPLVARPMTSGNDNKDSIVAPRPQTSGGTGSRPFLSRSSNTASSDFLTFNQFPLGSLPSTPGLSFPEVASPVLSETATSPTLNIPFSFETDTDQSLYFKNNLTLPTPPASPSAHSSPSNSVSYNRKSYGGANMLNPSTSLASLKVTPGRPKPLSILYAPHGLPLADLQPYVRTHLVRTSALPLTLLLHCFDRTQNPLLLGGNINAGAGSGLDIARGLMARCWISAHDEQKDDRGFASSRLKTIKCPLEEVRRRLWEGKDGESLRKIGWMCDVRVLAVGAEVCLSAATRDLVAPTRSMEEAFEAKDVIGFGITAGG